MRRVAASMIALLAAASCGDGAARPPVPQPAPKPGGPVAPPAVGTVAANPAPRRDPGDIRTDPAIEWTSRGSGPEIRAGDIAEVHLVGTLADGRVFDSTRTKDLPFAFEVGRGKVIPGLDRVILRLKVGDRVKTVIPAPLAYGAVGIPGAVPPGSDLTYDVEVLGTIPRPKWEVVTKGEGLQVRPGATVAIHYDTWLPDGKKVDSSRAGAPFRFRAGAGDVIEGWDRAVVQMRVGDRWKGTVPWYFAYGSEGAPDRKIPRRQDYVFEIEVIGVE